MECDYLIVGAGSAGCVVDKRLADVIHRVVLFETGGSDTYHWVHIPIEYLYCTGNPHTDWCFRKSPKVALNGRSLRYLRDKLLGRCSSINDILYLRRQPVDYDGWRQTGLFGRGWADVLPYFMDSEDYIDGPSDMHGAGGEWWVENHWLHWDVLDDSKQVAMQRGLLACDDFITGVSAGVGCFRANERNGLCLNTAKAFLCGAQKNKLRIETHAHSKRIFFNGRRVLGVEFEQHDVVETVHAKAEEIVCAGAIGSPHLLQLSGIEQVDVLTRNAIPVRAYRPVSRTNLQDYLQLRCSYHLQGATTLNILANSFWGKAKVALEYAPKRLGPMAMAPIQIRAFAKSQAGLASAELEYNVQPLSLDAFGEPPDDFPWITASECNLRPESCGSVELTLPDLKAIPHIALTYSATLGECQVVADAIRLTRHIIAAPALRRYVPVEIAPRDRRAANQRLNGSGWQHWHDYFHPSGTVAMGAETDAPLDEQFRLHSFEGCARLTPA